MPNSITSLAQKAKHTIRILSTPEYMEIYQFIKEKKNPSQSVIATHFNLSQPRASQKLATLQHLKLIRKTCRGKHRHYSTIPHQLTKYKYYLERIIQQS